MSDVIARETIFGARAGGQRFTIEVTVGIPFRVEGVDTEEWACALTVKPLLSKAKDVHGNSSVQALCLALSLAIDTLETFKSEGGSLTYEQGNEYELWPLSFGAAARPPGVA